MGAKLPEFISQFHLGCLTGSLFNSLRVSDLCLIWPQHVLSSHRPLANESGETPLDIAKVKSESEVTQLCPTLSDPMDCSLPGPSAHGIFQARVLEWGASAFSAPPH